MENKKLGILLVIISIIFGFFVIYYNSAMGEQSDQLGCNLNDGCSEVSSAIGISHIGFGFFGFMLALGFYMLFFNKTEQNILRRLDEEKNRILEEEKFSIIMRALDDYEKRVISIVKEQDGITQNTLRLRTDLSKAKLSYVLQELERRNLIKRIPKGKTLEVHLRV